MKTKSILILLLSIFLFSCNNNTNKTATESLAREKKLQDSIANNIVDSIAKSIIRQINLSKDMELSGVSHITGLINKQFDSLPQTQKENIFIQYRKTYHQIIDKSNSSYDSRLKYTSDFLVNDSVFQNKLIKEFDKELSKDGAVLSGSSDGFYIDAEPDYLYKIFKGKISDALTQYLKLNSKELKEGFSCDAGMLISFDQLYKRVINWEDFINKNPNFFLEKEAIEKYNLYLETLLSGMDNDPIFEREPAKLLPDIKRLYEKIIAKNESRNSTKKVTAFYNELKKNNFIYVEKDTPKEINSTKNSSTNTSTQTLPNYGTVINNSYVTISFFAKLKDYNFVSCSNNVFYKQDGYVCRLFLRKQFIPTGKSWTYTGCDVENIKSSNSISIFPSVKGNLYINGNEIGVFFGANGQVTGYRDKQLFGGTGRLELVSGDSYIVVLNDNSVKEGTIQGKLSFKEK